MSKHTIDRQALAMRIQQLEGLTNDDEEAMTYAYVPRKHILGKAYLRYWPFSSFGTLYK